MEFLQTVLKILQLEMETPTLYGWYHFLWLGITVAATVLLCVFHRKDKPERVRMVVLITALTVIALEIYKQIVFTFSVTETGISADYSWYAFPFQFCSTPMYIGLLAGLTKKGKLHDAFCAYLATYAMFAGICVMVYPGDVFIRMIGIDIQTMVCHGSMIVIGIYLLYTQYVKLEHKTILKAIPVFASCLTLASILNEVAYYSGLLETDSFNMFYISRHLPGSLPVYSMVQEVVPFPFCLIIYIAAFSLAAYLIMIAAIGIKTLSGKRERITASARAVWNRSKPVIVEAFNMRKHRGWKIAGAVLTSVIVFLAIVNIIPPSKNEEPNPFVVEEGELPMIAAHRGGGDCNPENTMLAFKEAVNTYRVDIIESDLYITADGYLVYSHNSYIDENCNVNGDMTLEEVKELCLDEKNRHYIKDMTLAELQQYNFGYYFTDENGEYIYRDVTDAAELAELGLQIATVDKLFEEFYATHPDLLFIIEIKNSAELGYEACETLYETLDKYPEYMSRVVVGTFHDEVSEKLKKEYPKLLRGASTGTAATFIATQFLGVNLFADGDFACLQIPQEYDLGIELSLDEQSIVDKAHDRNIAVQYWTVNDEDDMRKLIELGVDCIMTDDPELLAKIIEEYRQKAIDAQRDAESDTESDSETETEAKDSVGAFC